MQDVLWEGLVFYNMSEIIKKFNEVPKRKPKPDLSVECEECAGYGILQRNPEFKEPYGYPYRAARIECPECKGFGWIEKK